MELTSTEGGTIEVFDVSSADDLILTVDISSSSDVEMVGVPGLGYEVERTRRTPLVAFRRSDSRTSPSPLQEDHHPPTQMVIHPLG